MDPDAALIRADFATLAEIAEAAGADEERLRVEIERGRLPEPSYLLDGEGRFPRDLLALIEDAGSADAVRARFEERYCLAADAAGAVAGPDELDEAWEGYIAGVWGRLLAETTPEAWVRATRLVGSIAELLAEPVPDDPRWVDRLRGRIDALAAILREGCARDRANGEEHPWDAWVVAPRRDFAGALGRTDEQTGPGALNP